MTTKIRFVLCAVALLAPAGLSLCAADPTPARSIGRVLILENERTLEGEISLQGDSYILQRPVGQTAVPATKVLRLCADFAEAYTYLRTRTNLEDPDERLRLAQWCQRNSLREQSLAEVNAALALRPSHAESLRLKQSLERSGATTSPPPAVRPKEEPESGAPAPAAELTGESLGIYVTKVQPILMNACASCHATGRGGAFKLLRTFDGSASRKTTQQNLTAVLTQINLDRPQLSPLLIKAVNLHSEMTQAPLKGRDARAYHTLEEWVQLTIKSNPQLRESSATSGASPSAGDPKTSGEFASSNGTPVSTDAPAPRPLTTIKPAIPPSVAPDGNGSLTGGPRDAFDPLIFNRQMHPEKKSKSQ